MRLGYRQAGNLLRANNGKYYVIRSSLEKAE
jgi:hypothetical protein